MAVWSYHGNVMPCKVNPSQNRKPDDDRPAHVDEYPVAVHDPTGEGHWPTQHSSGDA